VPLRLYADQELEEMNLKITRTLLPAHHRYYKFFGFVDKIMTNDWAGLHIQGYGHREVDMNDVTIALAKLDKPVDFSLDTRDRVCDAREANNYYNRFDWEDEDED
jgi:hypothetical protein